ncbi:ectonucleoside triphosphate diphosphohydrolase 4 [Nannochloropsis gaditana]|uniref:Ectonucleoside triphosphate diphosphohydrolase 4 n=1 Tax=Nannochloropsis gaditana TaxID=72520 RepID=W7TQ28_9STRA|nr:ectonucleoside triphosphate diphosphohydrolase 4 [Nannochloropsis gaditana]
MLIRAHTFTRHRPSGRLGRFNFSSSNDLVPNASVRIYISFVSSSASTPSTMHRLRSRERKHYFSASFAMLLLSTVASAQQAQPPSTPINPPDPPPPPPHTSSPALNTEASRKTNMKITWPTQHGLIIDAGSTGSRMHVYQWDARRFDTVPPPFSFPLTSNRWTNRLAPGISAFADCPQNVGTSLDSLISFAREVLAGKEHQFKYFPIYLKATGGMRQLSPSKREAIIDEVRKYMMNKTTCPFYFEHDFARVVSGEEEGIYGWTAINFLLGKLLPASAGTGTVDANSSVGALDLGGASAQISFFVPDQDILANMFKLQIGAQKHWNVYVHSFLYFGINSARDRLHDTLTEEAQANKDRTGKKKQVTDSMNAVVPSGSLRVTNPCLPKGYEESFRHQGKDYVVEGATGSFSLCMDRVVPLLRKDLNSWCNFAHNHQCSFAGVYQPDLPPAPGNFGEFYGFGTFKDIWKMLAMPDVKANMSVYKERTEAMCALDWDALQHMNKQKKKKKREKSLPYLAHYCFVAAFGYALLTEGYGFEASRNLTVVSKIDGLKVTWALGAMLYEINALPWEYAKPPTWITAFIGSFLLNILLFAGVIFFLRKSHLSAAAIINRKRGISSTGLGSSDRSSDGIGGVSRSSYQSIPTSSQV